MSVAVSFAIAQNGVCAMIVGSVTPGTPASLLDEQGYVQQLVNMGANQTISIGANTYQTFGYDAPSTTISSALKFDPPANPATVTGYQFVLGKFGSQSWVWELGVGESFNVPQIFGDRQSGLSHYSVFNGTPNNVPDAGTSITLLGMSLLGLAGVRKALGKR